MQLTAKPGRKFRRFQGGCPGRAIDLLGNSLMAIA
jgi:hypothetical protein